METKVVYVLTSSENDYYLEQTILSAASLRMYNKECHSILVIDETTYKTLVGARKNILNYFDDFKVVQVPSHLSQVQSSRYIKTSLRKYIDGNFLFIDGDTIIGGNLSDIDTCHSTIASTLDCHLPISAHQHEKLIRKWAHDIGWEIKCDKYFNSGVMYVSDREEAYMFYDLWHKKWLENVGLGLHRDQPSLGLINEQMNNLIYELGGEWNCQIYDNGIKYFSSAKIIHYFSSRGNLSNSNPFILANNQVLRKIREDSCTVCPEIKKIISSRQDWLSKEITLLGKDEALFFYSPLSSYLRSFYKKYPQFYHKIEKFFTCIRKGLK